MRVRGRITGQLEALVADLSPTVVPPRTAITVVARAHEPAWMVAGLDATGAQVEHMAG